MTRNLKFFGKLNQKTGGNMLSQNIKDLNSLFWLDHYLSINELQRKTKQNIEGI
jgi:hypothetical protein